MNSSINVYYDGLCLLCSREIEHYMRQNGSESINFIDITSSSFDPEQEGVDPRRVHKVMHVKKSNGEFATEVEAFIEIWQHLPKYQWAARLAQKKSVRLILDAGYIMFAMLRPYLPKRQRQDCSASPYCAINTNEVKK